MEGCLPPPPQYDRPFPQAVLDEQEAPMLTWLEVRGRAEPVQGAQEGDSPAAWQPWRGGEGRTIPGFSC